MTYHPRLGDPKAICDICGFEFNLSALRMNWKHQMVCRDDFEVRHPQEFVRGVKDDQGVKPNMRPEPEEVYIAAILYREDGTPYARELGGYPIMRE